MNVTNYIAEFLLDKGYVLLPGLGSFLTTYQPAQLDEQQGVIQPPAHVFSFDPLKNSGDNSLARFIAGRENVPVSFAENEIEEYVEGCHYVINKGKRLEIPGVGLLYRGEQDRLVYEQDPSLITEGDFYGLTEVPAKVIVKKSKKVSWVKLAMVAMILAGLVFAGFYAPWFAGYMKTKVQQIFSGGDTAAMVSAPPAQSSVPVTDTISSPPVEPSAAPAEVQKAPEPTTQAPEASVAAQQPSKPARAVPSTGKQYYIVAGCFLSPERAGNVVKKLQSSGYNSRVFGVNDKGLTMVCYDAYPDRNQALLALQKIRKENNPQAWLLLY